MDTIEELVFESVEGSCEKNIEFEMVRYSHSMKRDFLEEKINDMSNVKLLGLISEAIEKQLPHILRTAGVIVK